VPEDNVINKNNESYHFVITDAFKRLSVETQIWISSALLASISSIYYMPSSSWNNWIPFGFATHFRAHRTWQVLYENLEVQGAKFCIAKRKGCALR